jgi:predicted PurR-regulated permease PerM
VSWRALVVIGLVWLLLQVAVVPFFSAPIVVALITAPALSPVLDALIHRGLSRTAAALAVTGGTVIVITVVFALTVASLASSMNEILSTANLGVNNLHVGSAPAEFVNTFGGGIASTVTSLITGVATTTLGLAISILLVFFFLRDGPTWWHAIVQRIPGTRGPQVDQVGTSSVSILRGTMTGTAIVSFAGAVLQFITMAILGLPLAFPISVLMFFLGFIPYIGGFIATALGFLVALAVGSQLDIILMFIFTIVFNIVQGNIVQPLVFGKTVNVHPAVVLLAAPAGFAIAGVLGMVIVTPIYSIISHNWRTVLHMFDPEDTSPEASAPRASTPAAPAAVPPVVGREGPAVTGAGP